MAHDSSDTSITDVPSRQRFEARTADGEVAGYAAYHRDRDRVLFTHTEVDDAYEGLGIGSKLARVALDQVRAEGLLVEPRCPFIKGWIDKHPDYRDLLAG